MNRPDDEREAAQRWIASRQMVGSEKPKAADHYPISFRISHLSDSAVTP